jgi:hypothetical protein
MIRTRSASRITTAQILLFFLLCSSAAARECIDCHSRGLGSRVDVVNQMRGRSHHVQGVALTGRHCYACHWEASADGGIDERYHSGGKETGATVDLVVWGAGFRPAVYKPISTAITFQSAVLGSTGERDAVAGITRHCLGCHNDRNNEATPFEGDRHVPRQYAWDGQSVAARYSQKGTAPWGKYSTAQTNRKRRVTKSFSAHGNAAANQGGWSAVAGYDGDMPLTRGGSGAKNVECFDCHNSHGSSTNGVTTSYRTFDGSQNGGLLKETISGKGGYGMSYRPIGNAAEKTPNPYSPGAGLCFDCHETARTGATPWGYLDTFGATQPIMGYKDTLRFGAGVKGSTSRFSGRQTRTDIASSHLRGGKFLNYSAHGRIEGLCTPCHDPHGVSPTLGNTMPYALPLLKGAWLTSPYREDAPPVTLPTRGAYAGKAGNMSMSWEKGDLKAGPGDTQAAMSYNTDRNTFGEGKHIGESEVEFGGLCLTCHRRENFINNRNDTIHRAVKGWGANREHAFPCSKCHQPHNSGLPRLMQTNCLESGPPGLRDSSAAPWFSGKIETGNRVTSQPATPASTKKTVKEAVVGCHVRRAANRGGGQPGSQPDQWKSVNPW